MFERFTDEARAAIVAAQEEARALGHDWIGTEHVLLGVLRGPAGSGGRLLAAYGLTLPAARADVERIVGRGEPSIDADALATLGIDLDAVRERVEETFGPGALGPGRRCRRGGFSAHVPFTSRAKKALELTLREAIHGRERSLHSGHLVLGLLHEGEGVAATILGEHGLRLETAREWLRRRDDRVA